MGAGYVRLANGIDDKDSNNDEDDESAIDNNEEDELDAELDVVILYYRFVFIEKQLKYKYNNSSNNKLNYTAKKWSGHSRTNRTSSY